VLPLVALADLALRRSRPAEALAAAEDFTARLGAHPEVEEIVVFGSFAEGRWAPGSDLDVFVVLTRSPKSVRDRIPELLPRAFPVGVDLFPYTQDEIAARVPSALLDTVERSRWRYARGRPPNIGSTTTR